MKHVLLLVASILPAGAAQVLVPAGTLIHCTLSEPAFSSATAELGDPTLCEVRPFRRPGQILVGRGYQLAGRLSEFRDPGRFVGKGWLKIEFDRMLNADTEIPIDAKVVAVRGFNVDAQGRIKGHGHPKRDAVGWFFPFLWPVKIATLPGRGPRPVMKGEMQLTLRLMDDIVLPVQGLKQVAEAGSPSAFVPSEESAPPSPGWKKFGAKPVEWKQYGSK